MGAVAEAAETRKAGPVDVKQKRQEPKRLVRENPEDRYPCIFLEDDDELGIVAEECWYNEKGELAQANKPQHLMRYQFAANYVPMTHPSYPPRVLDVGCGSGYGCAILTAVGAVVVGLDKWDKAIEYAEKHYGNTGARFKVLDIRKKWDVPDDYCDMVCAFEIVEHVEDGEWIFKEARRVLRPGGIFMVSTPVRPEGAEVKAPFHVREYTGAEFARLMHEYVDEWGMYVSTDAGFRKWNGEEKALVLGVGHKMAKQIMARNPRFKQTMIDQAIASGYLHRQGDIVVMDGDMEYMVTFHDAVDVARPDGSIREEVTQFMVRDLTREATPENTRSMQAGGNVLLHKAPVWLDHWKRNKERVKEGKWKREDVLPEQADVVYIFGTSPSLEKNKHLIPEIRNGVTIGVNGATALVDPKHIDYYMTLESEKKDRIRWWWQTPEGKDRDLSHCIGVFPALVDPRIVKHNWREIRWFMHSGDNEIFNLIRSELPGMLLLDSGFSVSYTALGYAALMKPKAIVLLGHDCCFPGGKIHADGERPPERNRHIMEAYEVQVPNRDGEMETYVTTLNYEQIARNISHVAYFFLRKGIRFINATEGGLIYGDFRQQRFDGKTGRPEIVGRWEIERLTLAEVLEEFEK